MSGPEGSSIKGSSAGAADLPESDQRLEGEQPRGRPEQSIIGSLDEIDCSCDFMSYQVIARKYRPQTFSQIVGQEIVTKTLQNAITSGRIAHAFLFSGVRGVGKTTTARILAKALNCQKEIESEPCGECDSCREIALSTSIDVQEIDAASNTGVDSIRELREGIRYRTARDRNRIYIIDEVHMLSTQAFNALLKTLEEPPDYVKFILATTELQKIPETIKSRCQQFTFKPISFNLILERLRQICEAEEISISEYALHAIVNAGQGSLRDAQSALDQVLSFGGHKIADEDVRALLGVVDQKLVQEVTDALYGRKREVLIRKLRTLWEAGIDATQFCQALAQHVRNLMVCRVAGWDAELLHLPDSEQETVVSQAESWGHLELLRLYDMINQTQTELKWHSHPNLHLEMSLVRSIELHGLSEIEDVIAELRSGQPGGTAPDGGSSGNPEGRSGNRAQPVRQAAPPSEPEDPSTDRDRGVAAGQEDPAPVSNGAAAQVDSGKSDAVLLDGSEAVGALLKLLEREKKVRLLQALQPPTRLVISDGELKISLRKQDIHAMVLEETEAVQALKEYCRRILGSTPRLAVEIVDDDVGQGSDREDPEKDPLIQAFMERFPGKIDVKRTLEE